MLKTVSYTSLICFYNSNVGALFLDNAFDRKINEAATLLLFLSARKMWILFSSYSTCTTVDIFALLISQSAQTEWPQPVRKNRDTHRESSKHTHEARNKLCVFLLHWFEAAQTGQGQKKPKKSRHACINNGLRHHRVAPNSTVMQVALWETEGRNFNILGTALRRKNCKRWIHILSRLWAQRYRFINIYHGNL